MPSAQRTGISSVSPMVDVTLRLSGIMTGISSTCRRQAWRRDGGRSAARPPAPHRGVPGSSSTGRAPTNPNAAVSPGETAMPCASTAAEPRQCSHAVVVASAAGAADGDNQRRLLVSRAPLRAIRRLAEAALPPAVDNGANEHRRRAASISGVLRRAAADDANARRADRHLLNAGRGHDGDIDGAQSLAGAAQRRARRRIAAGGQHALARRDRGDGLGTIAAQRDGIERQHRIGAARATARRHRCAAASTATAPAHRDRRRRSRRLPRRNRRATRSDAAAVAAATTSSASVQPRACAKRRRCCGSTAPTRASMSASTALSGVRRVMRCDAGIVDHRRYDKDDWRFRRLSNNDGKDPQSARPEMPAAGAAHQQGARRRAVRRYPDRRMHRSARRQSTFPICSIRPATCSKTPARTRSS